LDNCLSCSAGYFCNLASSSQQPCPSGSWSSRLSATSQVTCRPCSSMASCPSGSVAHA
jgi:hypothetical protein